MLLEVRVVTVPGANSAWKAIADQFLRNMKEIRKDRAHQWRSIRAAEELFLGDRKL